MTPFVVPHHFRLEKPAPSKPINAEHLSGNGPERSFVPGATDDCSQPGVDMLQDNDLGKSGRTRYGGGKAEMRDEVDVLAGC
jgi:hypothetical protein